MKQIQDLKFPLEDSKQYLTGNQEDFEFFNSVFVSSIHLEGILNRNVFFLVGDKGTGKTAYAVYLSKGKSSRKGNTVFVEKDDFSKFLDVAKELEISASDYQVFWTYCILIVLAHSLTRSEYASSLSPNLTSFGERLDRLALSAFTGSIGEAIELSRSINLLCSTAAENQSKPLSEKDLSNATNRTKLHFLNQLMIDLLKQCSASLQFDIFVDGIDIRPDDIDYPTYIGLVSALANTVWLVNATQLQKIDPKLRVVLLVRPDIIGAINIHNRGTKLRDNAYLLDWLTSYEIFDKSALFRVADSLLASQQVEAVKWPGAAWSHYFDFKVYSRKTNSNSDDPFISFLRHSWYKPRDIISYMKIMAEHQVSAGTGSDESFSPHVFRDPEIKRGYGKYMLEETRDGLQFYYNRDEFELFLNFFTFLREFVDSKLRSFKYTGFCDAHRKFMTFVNANQKAAPQMFSTADEMLQLMYELNLICFRYEGQTKKGMQIFTKWCFRERSFSNMRPKITLGAEYELHYGIARSLYTDVY